MGKATNPRQRRQQATDELRNHGEVERVNGVDINRGGSPLTRWRAKGRFTATQDAAINYCLALWDAVGMTQRVTASYGERISGGGYRDESGWAILHKADAKDALARICGGHAPDGTYKPGYIPRPYWSVFENCIRHDEPAGVAGSRLGYGNRSAQDRAHTVVCFVADLIADAEGIKSY